MAATAGQEEPVAAVVILQKRLVGQLQRPLYPAVSLEPEESAEGLIPWRVPVAVELAALVP
jgi:hypothetical protein